jgi:hypothetical protein
MARARHAPLPFVIVSGYGTSRQSVFGGGSTWDPLAYPWRARSLEIAKYTACIVGARRKRLAIVRDFGTRRERVVWERNRK